MTQLNGLQNKKVSILWLFAAFAVVIIFLGGMFLWQRFMNSSPKPGPEEQTTVEKTGRIYRFGSDPWVNIGLEVEGEQTYCLVGPLENDLINNYQDKTATVRGVIVQNNTENVNAGFCPPEFKTIKVTSIK